MCLQLLVACPGHTLSHEVHLAVQLAEDQVKTLAEERHGFVLNLSLYIMDSPRILC